jgi:hypothetical protein
MAAAPRPDDDQYDHPFVWAPPMAEEGSSNLRGCGDDDDDDFDVAPAA